MSITVVVKLLSPPAIRLRGSRNPHIFLDEKYLMETWGFTLYKTFDFDWFLTFAVREYPIQNNNLFLRGTGKLKNLKSPVQVENRKKLKSSVQEGNRKIQSPQCMGEFVNIYKIFGTWEKFVKTQKFPVHWKTR